MTVPAGGSASDVPHQVPPGPRRFVNRDDELDMVSSLLAGPSGASARIVLCTGLPGVGKTSLVRKIVERIGRFPGGELLVEFAESAAGGVSVGDAVTSCLTALGVADAVMPSAVSDRVGLYRTRTATQPVLVVLDDVADPAQVSPLVPSAPGSVVLVTSTARLTELQLDGAEPVDLAPLDDAAGAQLLCELGGVRVAADPAALARLVAECGGLPIALRAAAARLLARKSLPVAELADEIADERRGLDAFAVHGQDRVVAVFSVVYRQLTVPAARLYRLLGVLPGPDFSAQLAAAAGGHDEPAAAEMLDELVEASLLSETAGGRFRLHSLVRRHAYECALAEETAPARADAVYLAMEHLWRRAAFADRAVLGEGRYRCIPHDLVLGKHIDPFGGPRGKNSALRWLDGERGNLAAAVHACVEYGWHDLAWQLAESATALYVSLRYLVDWTQTSELGARAAGIAGNPAAEARLRSFASRPWTELGDLPRARAELDAAFSLAGNLGDVRLLASIHEMDGRYHDAAGDPVAAVTAFRRAIELFGTDQDARGVAFVTYFRGAAQLRTGDVTGALGTLENARELVRAQHNSRMTGRVLITIADGLGASGDDAQARLRLDEAITVLGAAGEDYYEAQARERLAELAVRAGDRQLAKDCLRRVRDVHMRLGSGRIEELERRLVALSRP